MMTLFCCALLALGQAGANNNDPATAKLRRANLKRMVEELTPQVAKLYGAPASKSIPFKIVSRADIESKMSSMVMARRNAKRAERLGIVFSLLHLTGQDDRYFRMPTGGYAVAGLYDPGTKVLFVLDDQPNAFKWKIVSHELAHAFQDMRIDLTHWGETATLDGRLAIKALIEGQADVVAEKVMEAKAKEDAELGAVPLPDRYTNLGAGGLDQGNFAYVAGADFVKAAATADDPIAMRAFKKPPKSTAQVIEPKLYQSDQEPIAGKIGLAKLTGARPYLDDTVGREVLDLVGKEKRLGGDFGEGWRGDRLEVGQFVDEPGAAWAISFRDKSRAREFAFGYGSLLGTTPEGDSLRVEQRDGTISSVSSSENVVAILEHIPKKWVKQVEAATLAAFGPQVMAGKR